MDRFNFWAKFITDRFKVCCASSHAALARNMAAIIILDEIIYSLENNKSNLAHKNEISVEDKCLIYPCNFLSNIKYSRTEEAMLKKLNFLCEDTREKAYANWSASNWSYWNATMVSIKLCR